MAEFIIENMNSYGVVFAINFSIFIAFITILSIFGPRAAPMNRFQFGLIYVAIVAAHTFSVHLFRWVSTIDIDLAAITWLAFSAILMGLLAHYSRRRSMDAYGESVQAFLSAIPLLCLILILEGPKYKERISTRTRSKFAARAVLFGISFIAIFSLLTSIRVAIERETSNMKYRIEGLNASRVARIEAAIANSAIHDRIESRFSLKEARYSGSDLFYTYQVDGEVFSQIKDGISPSVKKNLCSDRNLREILSSGVAVTFEYVFLNKSMELLKQSIKVDLLDCQI